MKTSVPIKVAIGYAIIIAIFTMAAWMVYANTRTFMRINQTERAFMQRRDVIDSLVYSFMQMNNKERAISLGDTDQWDDFDRSLHRTIALSERLQEVLADSTQDQKIDSLQLLLRMKRENTLLIMRLMAQNEGNRFLAEKVNSLHKGADSVMIHPKAAEVKDNKVTVYEVVKSRKGFFARLADAFKRQHADTVSVKHNHTQENDTTKQSIDIAHDVANVLSDIAQKDDLQKRQRRQRLAARERQQQLVSIQIADQTEQLLRDIRSDEHNAKEAAFEHDIEARHAVMAKVVLLALVSLLSALVLVYFVWRDVKREQRDRQRLKAAKDETERLMAQRERLMLTITHDIKAPAASISGFIQLLDERMRGDAKAASYVQNIGQSATHLLHLVTALLDYHRLESGNVETHPVTFSAARLVSECADSIRPQAMAKGLRVVCHVEGCTQEWLRGDAFRIKQIVDNLVSNAFKYTAEGSITIKAATSSDRLTISVTDTGLGMTEEETRRVFNAFARLTEAQGIEGVGLGLSIVKELTSLLHGDIQVTSQKGKGTTFRLTLPIEPVAHGDAPSVSPSVPSASSSLPDSQAKDTPAVPSHLLILDDDKLQRQLVAEMVGRLSPTGWRVTAYRYVAEAIQQIRQAPPAVCLIDIEMPEMNGMQVARLIGRKPGMRLIAMTAHDASIMPRLKEAGFDACLFKPIRMEQLAKELNVPVPTDLPQAAKPSSPSYDLSPLTAFASGDEEAEREILGSFKHELDAYLGILEEALATLNRKQAAHVGHKALPVLTLIGAQCVPQLQVLSPEHINELADEEMKNAIRSIIEDMRRMAKQVGDVC